MAEVAARVPVGHMRSDVSVAKRPPGGGAESHGD